MSEMDKYRRIILASLTVVVLGAGLAGAAYLASTRPAPPRQAVVARVPEVAVVPVMPCTFRAPVVGHGTVQAKRQVKIVPEVGGRLVHVDDDLAVGKIIPKGKLLFEIDSRSYQLQVDQAEAKIDQLEAQLARLHPEKQSLASQLQVGKDLLALAERNRAREKNLEVGVFTTDVEVVVAEMAYLRQKEQVLQCESKLAVIPHRIHEVKALLAMQRSQLAEAELRLANTRIESPFDARVESIKASESQVVIASLAIATLTDMEALELVAGVDPRELRWTELRSFARAVGEDLGTPPEATIIWSAHDQQYTWRGPVTRLERLDELTRTARIVVEIRDVMDGLKLESGAARPPLSIGMFCRVEIPAEPLPNALVVPRSAVQTIGTAGSRYVYVFEPDDGDAQATLGRLALRRVPVLRTVGDEALVCYEQSGGSASRPDDVVQVCELQPGEEIIVSVLPKAVEGMRLRRRPSAQVARCGQGELWPSPTPEPSVVLTGMTVSDIWPELRQTGLLGLCGPFPGDS